MENERPNKRARSAAACIRCKHRKQKCDNSFPTCAACSLAGETCSYENRVYRAEHVEALEKRIVDLERQLQQSRQQNTPHSQQNVSSLVESPAATVVPRENGEADAAFDMLSPNSYLGTSSGFPLARTLHSALGRPGISSSQSRKMQTSAHVKPASPDKAMGSHFVNTYLLKVHPKHAFIPPRRILNLHSSCEALAASARPVADSPIATRIDFFVLHLIYAIGARYMQLSQNEFHCDPEAHYAAAIEDVECLFENRNLESLEGILLLCIFQLRSPSKPGIWSMIGIAMRHALSFGLHRKFKGSIVMDQRRKRMFWTLYMLERSIARTLGLPVCISDRDIEVDLPANVPEDIEDDAELKSALQQNRGSSAMSACIHIFRLAQLESRIYSSIHRVDRPVTEDFSHKISLLRQRLNEWKSQIAGNVPNDQDNEDPSPNSYISPKYHVLHYHRVTLLLLLPNLTRLAPTHPDFHLCVTSAGQVVQLYKKLHDHQNTLSYSLIALHATFVAGLTLVFCFLASERAIFNPQFSSDIRACSTVLYIISERWPAARKVRDAFERMVSLTVERDERSDDVSRYGTAVSSQSPRVADGQAGMNHMWHEVAAEMPGSYLHQNDGWSGGLCSDPNDFWNCLGPWLGDEADGLGSSWLDLDAEGLACSNPLAQNSDWFM